MKDWIISAGLALAALALFWVLLFPKPGGQAEPVSKPISTEAGAAGYRALDAWLAAEHVPVVHWQSRFGDLRGGAGAAADEGGDVLITTMPHTVAVRRQELEKLDAWVQRGNTLVVMAALDDTPRWSALAYSSDFDDQLARILRLKISIIPEPDIDGIESLALKDKALAELALRRANITLEPIHTLAGPHPLFAGVASVSAHSELPASRWQVTPMDESPLLELARRTDTGDAAVWVKRFGKGTVLLSAFATPFSNERLGEAGNARWLGNILALSLGAHGRVLLDDAHQGVVDYYDANKFFADPRLAHALGWLVLVWFVYVVFAPHLRAATGGRPPIDDVAMLRVTARFYAGALAAPAVGARLLEHFFNAIRRRRSLREDGTPVWDWLESQARVSREDLAELRALHARTAAGRAVDLVRLQTLLSTLSGHIA